ncbi:uncharacterized protein METZ01_LOCUS425114 [marine metagenome]|uniref:Uncharacterized protein n=1 Tax=marine metagenome TaxID=408172 RepID=A0A382XN34_9ZZZZ
MNFKAMNMKKGFKRLWIIGSVFWLLYPFIPPPGNVFGIYLPEFYPNAIIYFIASQIIWWAIFFLGFWVARGFVDDDDTKAGF